MPVLAAVQLGGFLICIASGFVLGALYDIVSALRLNMPVLKIASSVLDAFFWIIFALMFFITLQLFCGGEFYWFFLVGAIMGFILYIFTLSKILMPVIQKIICFFIGCMKRILHTIFRVYSIILHFFSPVGRILRKFVQFILKRIINFVKKNVEILRRFGVLLKKV